MSNTSSSGAKFRPCPHRSVHIPVRRWRRPNPWPIRLDGIRVVPSAAVISALGSCSRKLLCRSRQGSMSAEAGRSRTVSIRRSEAKAVFFLLFPAIPLGCRRRGQAFSTITARQGKGASGPGGGFTRRTGCPLLFRDRRPPHSQKSLHHAHDVIEPTPYAWSHHNAFPQN